MGYPLPVAHHFYDTLLMQKNKTLTTLILGDLYGWNNIGDVGATALAGMLQVCLL